MASNLGQSLDETLARLVSFSSDPALSADANDAGAILKRGWFWLAADAATGSAIADMVQSFGSVSGATRTNPKANNDPYSGTFVISKVEANDENEIGTAERAANIIETLTRVLVPTDYTSLAAITPKVMQQNEILNIFEKNTGERDLLGLKWINLAPSARSAMMAITDANFETTANGYVSGIHYDQKQWQEQDDKTCTLYVLFRTTYYQTDPTNINSYIETFVPNVGRQEETQTILWPNIAENAANAIYTDATSNYSNMASATYAAAPTGHKLKYIRKPQGTEGVFNVERVTYKPQSTGTLQWPPGDDEVNGVFTIKRYRRVADAYNNPAQEVRTWTFAKRTKYCVTTTEVQSFLSGWTASVLSTYSTYPERGTGWSQVGTDGLQWKATIIYQTNDSGWLTDGSA